MPNSNTYSPQILWYDDLAVGNRGMTASRTVTEHDVGIFAGLTGDNAELHTSQTYAAGSEFGGRIAHGMLTLVLTHGLMVRAGYLVGSGIALLGWDEVRFCAPVHFGDTIQAEWETISLRESKSRPHAGIVQDKVKLTNHRETIIMTGLVSELVRKHPT